jgi:uncharacterized protein YciI
MRPIYVAFALVCSLAAAGPRAEAQGATMPSTTPASPRDVRYVVFHHPGPSWLPGKSMFEQAGVREHVEHYRKLLLAGKLALGGPHLDDRGGGMMITTSGVPESEVKQFAAEDPAVKSGLLTFEVRPWLVGMNQHAK